MEYLTPLEASEYLGCRPWVVRDLLQRGVLEGHYPTIEYRARGLRLRKDELLAMLGQTAKNLRTTIDRPLGEVSVLHGVDGHEYLTPHAAAALVHVSMATIWRWLHAGAITGYHPLVLVTTVGVRLKRSELDALPRDLITLPSRHRRTPAAV